MANIRKSVQVMKGDEAIVCRICLSVYDDGPRTPLFLACRHTFCANCIADSLMMPSDRSKVFCPLCKSKTVMGKRGIAGLSINKDSLELVHVLEKRKEMERMDQTMNIRPDSGRPQSNPGVRAEDPRPLVNVGNNPNPGKQPKGILKVKLNQRRLDKTDFRVEKTSDDNGVVQGSRISSPLPVGKDAMDGKANGVVGFHEVIVKSVNRLHPAPNSTDPNELEQESLPLETVGMETSLTDINEMDTESGLSADQVTSDPLYSAVFKPKSKDNSNALSDGTDVNMSDTSDTDQGRSTLSDESIDGGGGTLSQSNGQIYPVKSLLSMATADQMTTGKQQQQLPTAKPAKYVGRFGKYSEKRQPGAMLAPQRISCSSDGTRLGITDLGDGAVHVFTSKGEFICTFSVPDTTGGLCFLNDGSHLMAVTTLKGVEVKTFNGVHKKTVPILGVIAVAHFKQGFVTASRNRVSVCKSIVGSVIHSVNGKRAAGMTQKQIAFENIVDIAVGPKDELYILENRVILMTDEEGLVMSSIDLDMLDDIYGPAAGGRPVAISVCPGDQSVVLADDGNKRVLLFGSDGQLMQCLVNLNDPVHGMSMDCNVSGIAVNGSRKLYMVMIGKEMAEVRVYLM